MVALAPGMGHENQWLGESAACDFHFSGGHGKNEKRIPQRRFDREEFHKPEWCPKWLVVIARPVLASRPGVWLVVIGLSVIVGQISKANRGDGNRRARGHAGAGGVKARIVHQGLPAAVCAPYTASGMPMCPPPHSGGEPLVAVTPGHKWR